jgi:hypothetical protein
MSLNISYRYNQGISAELYLQAVLTSRNYAVSQPVGGKAKYDLIVDNGEKLFKVQVKSSNNTKKGRSVDSYRFKIKSSAGKNYQASEVDIFSLFIPKFQLFYHVPFSAVKDQSNIEVYTDPASTSRLSKYKDNWEIFKT